MPGQRRSSSSAPTLGRSLSDKEEPNQRSPGFLGCVFPEAQAPCALDTNELQFGIVFPGRKHNTERLSLQVESERSGASHVCNFLYLVAEAAAVSCVQTKAEPGGQGSFTGRARAQQAGAPRYSPSMGGRLPPPSPPQSD